MTADKSKLVFSTDGQKDHRKSGAKKPPRPSQKAQKAVPNDGFVYVRYERKGRKGKGVCVIAGVPGDKAKLKELAFLVKAKCGTGGTVKDGTIEIQGDFRDTIKTVLEGQGHKVKFSGG